MLGAPEDREPNVAVDSEDLATVLERNGAVIDVAALGIQNVAAGPLIAVLAHSPQDLQAQDRLVFERASAADAERMRNRRVKELFNSPVEHTLPFANGDNRLCLPRPVIHGLPTADR